MQLHKLTCLSSSQEFRSACLFKNALVPKLNELLASKRCVVVHSLEQHNNIFMNSNGENMESDMERERYVSSRDVISQSLETNIGAEDTFFKKSPRDITRDLITRVDVGPRVRVPDTRETKPITIPVRIVSAWT